MNREIKFRVWNGSELVYDIIAGKFGVFYVNPGDRKDGLDPKDTACLNPFNTIYSKECPTMQYTGLKDKNGVEIYEGDIVENVNFIGVVEYDSTLAAYVLNEKKAKIPVFSSTNPNSFSERIYGAALFDIVIGNIFENSELLK